MPADEPLPTLCRKGNKDEGGRELGDSNWLTAREARCGICGREASARSPQLLILPPPQDPELVGPLSQRPQVVPYCLLHVGHSVCLSCINASAGAHSKAQHR